MTRNSIFQNAKWIIVCKVIQSLIQLLIGMITARYLGPSNYGLISYAASLVAFAVPIMQLGLTAILVQECVTRPEEEGAVMGTGLGMSMISGLACMVGVFAFVSVANFEEPTTILVCTLYSVSIFFQATELLQYWFQARLLSKYASLAALGAYLVVSAYKISLLVTGKSIYWFALTHAVEYACTGILLLGAYRHAGGGKLSFSRKLAGQMFRKSKYYILANLMVTVFQHTDQVMLKMMAGNAENGFYTTAITCSIITQFVFLAVIDSARPVILEARRTSWEAFEQKLVGLYSVIIYAVLLQSIGFFLFAKLVVGILYGDQYAPAVQVLQILVWQTPFSYMGSIRNIWILAEEKHHVLWRINLCGVGANVVLNALLIPHWGACGAAFASVVTQFVTNLAVGFVSPSIRDNNRLLLRGLNPRNLLEFLRKLREYL